MSVTTSDGSMETLSFHGIEVKFPYSPYSGQRAMMAKTIKACLDFQNALLESPTGTGKSLALLAATLAYQHHVGKNPIFAPNKRDPYQHHPEELDDSVRPDFVRPSQLEPDDMYRCNVPLKKDRVPIWYTTRTHSQLKQMVGELKKLPYKPQLSILASRKRICCYEKVKASADADGACMDAIAKGECPYNRDRNIPNDLRPNGSLGKFDLEEFTEYCRQRMLCPYFKSRHLSKIADLVLGTYNLLLNPKVKGQMMLSILGVVLIIDEAHNVEGTIRETTSFKHTRKDLMLVIRELSQLIISERGTQLSNRLEEVRDMLSNYLRYIHQRTTEMRESRVREWIERDNKHFFDALNLNKDNWFQFRTTLDYVFVAVNSGINSDTKRPVSISMFVGGILEQLYVVMALCFKMHMIYMDSFCIVIRTRGSEFDDECLALNVNPGAYFSTIADEVNTVILSSGTLHPLNRLSIELGTPFQQVLSAPHVIGQSQLAGFSVSESIDGIAFTSAYKELSSRTEEIYRALGKTVLSLVRVIPAGVLMFVPSHDILNSLLSAWERLGILNSISKLKAIHRETGNMNDDVYEQYRASIDKTGSGFLIGVYRGKMSEGIDFYDDQCRAVIGFGIPYPPPDKLKIRLKRNYNDAKCIGISDDERGMNGSEWYDAQAFRALFQATGRCLRHARDYGAIILIDNRVSKHKDSFSNWMGASFEWDVSVSTLIARLATFYEEMKESFPIVQTMKLDRGFLLECSSCMKGVALVRRMSTASYSTGSRPGLRTMLQCADETGYIFFNAADYTILKEVVIGEIEWKDEDCCGYCSVRCQCGKQVGAVFRVGSAEEQNLLEGVWFIVEALVARQGSLQQALVTLTPKKKTKILSISTDGLLISTLK